MTNAESPTVVPDVSVAAKWYFDDEDTEQARQLHERVRRGTMTLLVPDCFFYEFVGLIRKAERRVPPRVTAERAREIVTAIVSLDATVVGSRFMLIDALRLSQTLDVAPYDALYLAIADGAGVTFVTADQKLYDRIKHLPYVRWLRDL
ncbi:MAG: type II toxin-antitoxin system VapC family toxin [Chloroflexota bacterium]